MDRYDHFTQLEQFHSRTRRGDIRSVRFYPSEEVLEVEFQAGGVYQYQNVPPAMAGGLITAPSPATYLQQFINDQYNATCFGRLLRAD
jgi:hypothetical protein